MEEKGAAPVVAVTTTVVALLLVVTLAAFPTTLAHYDTEGGHTIRGAVRLKGGKRNGLWRGCNYKRRGYHDNSAYHLVTAAAASSSSPPLVSLVECAKPVYLFAQKCDLAAHAIISFLIYILIEFMQSELQTGIKY